MPTVSVIIPTYNRAGRISRSIDSVLGQTLEDLELLVVDDASDDDTEAVVTAYDDDRVTYIRHETNRGGSAARNTGIDRATGRYVAFLDSDDEFYPTKLERQVETLESRSDDWVAAYCGVEVAYEEGEEPGALRQLVGSAITRRRKTEGAEGGAELIGDVLTDDLHTSAGSTLLVEREVAERIDGFDESFVRFQDPEFLIRVLEQGKLAFVDAPLVRRYASGNPAADTTYEGNRQLLEANADHVRRLQAEGRDVFGSRHYLLSKHYFRQGDFREGARHLAHARRPELRQFPGLVESVLAGVRRRTT